MRETENDAEVLCIHCGGEMMQFEDGPDDTLECAWCDYQSAPLAMRNPVSDNDLPASTPAPHGTED